MVFEPDLHLFLFCLCMWYVCTRHYVNNILWPNAAHMVWRDALTEQRFYSKLDHNHSHLYKIVSNLLANVGRHLKTWTFLSTKVISLGHLILNEICWFVFEGPLYLVIFPTVKVLTSKLQYSLSQDIYYMR